MLTELVHRWCNVFVFTNHFAVIFDIKMFRKGSYLSIIEHMITVTLFLVRNTDKAKTCQRMLFDHLSLVEFLSVTLD